MITYTHNSATNLTKIHRHLTVGIETPYKSPVDYDSKKLPYLISKYNSIGIYYDLNKYHSIVVDLVSGNQIFTYYNTTFQAISPNGDMFIQQNGTDFDNINIYKDKAFFGRVRLGKMLSDGGESKIWFMSQNMILQLSTSPINN